MDDGSSDGSYHIARDIAKKDNRVKAYALSRNYTSPYSQFAGLKVCTGACSIFVSDDFQRPVENIIENYRAWEAGHKIVISGRASRKDGFFSDLYSNTY